ncbi:pilus assembly protein PilZ [Pseudomonas sp. PA15(2017)]|uniref:PilZ domain-containing protein n=1 Tax=Pseudomonas sp. PA15(2017) TaxID=1932111 RepID=UPI00095B641A|nr:PilZ domain-containing protein [Pseudomonas sp. PA15(2017)]OLU28790.1 pilus assembly protein PilZ [Pseudomonas sp. PA15(2017)]
MTLDALQLDVPDALDADPLDQATLGSSLSAARQLPVETGLLELTALLTRLNRSAMTLLERQRTLQNFSDEYRHYSAQRCPAAAAEQTQLCSELAIGYKRLLLQILQGHKPSQPHLAWCLYMAQHFITQALLWHFRQYREPNADLWRDSHLLYWLGERHDCLDEPVAAAFTPTPADTLRGLYQQTLLLALSNPPHLHPDECLRLFAALAPLAALARLLPWDAEDKSEGPLIDLQRAQACLTYQQRPQACSETLRRLELGALLVALGEPAPLRSAGERDLLERVHPHWLGTDQRRHSRTPQQSDCRLAIGIPAIHAQLLEQRPQCTAAQILDIGPGGARLLCPAYAAHNLPIGQLVLLIADSDVLALVCWRHLNSEGIHLGLRYLKGLAQPTWLRRAPSSQPHLGILQSTPKPREGWHHGLWVPHNQFSDGENLWLQLPNAVNQNRLQLPAGNLASATVSRHPLELP